MTNDPAALPGVTGKLRCTNHLRLDTYRQWCFLTKKLNCVPQIGQYVASESGCHLGSITSDEPAVGVERVGAGLAISLVAGAGPAADTSVA